MTVGKTLRTLIEENNLTQKQLAHILNMAPSTLGGYVQGTSEPDIETLKRIAAYFEVSMDYLLDYSKNKVSVPGEQELLRIFRMLPPKGREFFLEQGKLLLKFHQKELPSPPVSPNTQSNSE